MKDKTREAIEKIIDVTVLDEWENQRPPKDFETVLDQLLALIQKEREEAYQLGWVDGANCPEEPVDKVIRKLVKLGYPNSKRRGGGMKLFKRLKKYFKGETKYVYVPDYRGRLLFSRMLIEPKSGYQQNVENGINILFSNHTDDKVEVVVYKYVTKPKSNDN